MGEPGAFLVENSPPEDPETNWADALVGRDPTMDKNGYLSGPWGHCLMSAIRFERTHRHWDKMPGYEDNGPAGHVIDYLGSQGLSDAFSSAADELENVTKERWAEMGNLDPEDDSVPEVWLEKGQIPSWEPEGFHENVAALFHDDTCWCCVSPIICGGFGCASPMDPCYLRATKCCCVEGIAYTEDCCTDEGCCYKFEKVCCIVSHTGCPPGGGHGDGVPMCACCNQRCGGEDEAPTESKLAWNDNARVMTEAFLCFYCLCAGCGVGSCCDPMYRQTSKFMCIRSEVGTADCCPDRGCCYDYGKMCCCIAALAPPCVGGGKHDGIPMCAFLGMKCGEDEMGAPKQEKMNE